MSSASPSAPLDAPLSPLTPRETDILRLLLAGYSTQGIARQLVLAPETVKWYTKQIYSKLDVHSRDEAITVVRALRLLPIDSDASSDTSSPVPLSIPEPSLLGRANDLARVSTLVRDARLVTLVGPPGVGKTRLSQHIAAMLQSDFADGAQFVELASVSRPEEVLLAIAAALEIGEDGRQPILKLLKRALAKAQRLLVLDNFEHVIEAAPHVAELLNAAPGLRVLVTSREALRLRGERVYSVPTLILDDAAALFAQRAQTADLRFRLTDDNRATVAAICARLDCLPLAIELAAARVRLLSPDALLERLSSRLNTLTRGARDLPPRQQTLRDTLAWSYDLLTEDEKQLFARLAVFSGGWMLDAAETVCGDGINALDALEGLVSRSLVVQTETERGDPRFTLLETLREYALERLDAHGETARMRNAHADYYATLATRADPQLRGAYGVYWYTRLAEEHDNLRTALRHTRDTGDALLLLRLSGALGWFWFQQTHITDGLYWTETALAHDSDTLPVAVRAHAYNAAGYLNFAASNHARASETHGKAVALYEAAGDKAGLAFSLYCLSAQTSVNDVALALQQLERAIALAREAGETALVSDMYVNLGNALTDMGETARALTANDEGLRAARETGNQGAMVYFLCNNGCIYLQNGEVERAEPLYEQGLALAREIGDRRMTCAALLGLGEVAAQRGNPFRAETLIAQGLKLARDTHDRFSMIEALKQLADVAQRTGSAARARTALREALELCADLDDWKLIADTLDLYARFEALYRDAARAARWLGAVDAWRVGASAFRSASAAAEDARARATLIRALGEDAETALAAGAALSLHAALLDALNS
jgi:predicted ATPase/DNA-binding CsgD family transcriptional regulator